MAFQEKGNKKTDIKVLIKQIIMIMIELFLYSLDSSNRKKFILESREKKYFKMSELKGVNV